MTASPPLVAGKALDLHLLPRVATLLNPQGAGSTRRGADAHDGSLHRRPNLPVRRGFAARTGSVDPFDKQTSGFGEVFRYGMQNLGGSYLLSYSPSSDDSAGWHAFTVLVSGHCHTIRARQGYER